MSLRANDELGFPKKAGVYSQVEFRSVNGTLASAYCGFLTLYKVRGNDIAPVADILPNIYTGFQLLSPGRYSVECTGVYRAGGTTVVYLVSSPPNVTGSPTADLSFFSVTCPTGIDIPLTSVFVAEGGEIIRVGTGSGVDPAANGGAIFRVTKLD